MPELARNYQLVGMPRPVGGQRDIDMSLSIGQRMNARNVGISVKVAEQRHPGWVTPEKRIVVEANEWAVLGLFFQTYLAAYQLEMKMVRAEGQSTGIERGKVGEVTGIMRQQRLQAVDQTIQQVVDTYVNGRKERIGIQEVQTLLLQNPSIWGLSRRTQVRQ